MASKMPKKRAKLDAAAKDTALSSLSTGNNVGGPSLCQSSPSNSVTACFKTGAGDGDAVMGGDGSAPTPTPSGQLRAELECARRCIEQLRQEKTDESRRAREQSDKALRELAERLREERQGVIEQVRQRCAAESSRATARHDRELQRLRNELDRCRAELDSRGGPSLDAGERARLLQKVSDATAAKRRAEEALRSAVDADRQKACEIRRLREENRAEVARVSKEANVEVRKLLEELKMKDHQLALLDRNQYPDHGIGLPPVKLIPLADNKDRDTTGTGQPRTRKSNKAVQHDDLLQAETMAALRADVERLRSELEASETDRATMKDRIDELNRQIAAVDPPNNTASTDISLTGDQPENVSDADTKHYNDIKSSDLPTKPQPKAVRFLLPGETLPVLARETATTLDDDGDVSINSDVSDSASLSSVSSSSSWSLRLSPDTTTLYDENIEKSYHLLLSEHLSLQRNVANLLSSWIHTPPVLPSKAEKPTCSQDCAAEKQSMKDAIETLKDKLALCEESEYQLRQQLKDTQEQNEDLEFRMLELQECVDKSMSAESVCSIEDLSEKNQSLEIEVAVLRQKLVEMADPRLQPSDAVLRLLSSSKTTTQMDNEVTSGAQQNSVVAEQEGGRLLDSLQKEDVPPETVVDSEGEVTDDQLGVMTCSMSSATSGFDDISCASSVADIEEMPSEETWNFDVQEEKESTATQSPTVIGARQITEDQVRQMEKIWLSRIEKLECRMMQAVAGERRVRDQIALITEEKDRRIAALERQVDMLEANDFHLSKTIHTLEQLERVFSAHFHSTIVEFHHLRSDASRCMLQEEAQNSRDKQTPADTDHVKASSDETAEMLGEVMGHRCGDRTCVQCHVCQTLQATINQLHSALAEQAEVDTRIRELEEGTKDSQPDDEAALEVVDFEAEYRQLEALVKELKQVLILDRLPEGCRATKDASTTLNDRSTESSHGPVNEQSVQWNLDINDDDDDDDDDETVSMVASPDSDINSPVLAALSERNRLLEVSEQYLRQQISDLEIERDQLREIVRSGEATIVDLGVSLEQLQASEKSMCDEASRLRAKNDWMAGRIDGLLELVGRLEEADRGHRAAAGELRLRAERHSAGEADLRRELDNAVDEQRRAETRCQRWVGQLEHERDVLASRVDELAERSVDLEGRKTALECRIRKMETVEQGLRAEVADLERALSAKEGEILEERLLMTPDDFQYFERSQSNCQTTGVVAFLKQKLERVDRSKTDLEERLREKLVCEERLRDSLQEYEKSDNIWQEKVISLEGQKRMLMQKIDDLQSHFADIKQRYQIRDDNLLSVVSADDTSCEELSQNSMSQGLTACGRWDSSMKGLTVPDAVNENCDDAELQAYWTVVETSTHTDSNEPALTSPLWANVERLMGLSANADEEKETFVKTAEKTKVETLKVGHLPQHNPLLPVSLHQETEMAGSSIPYESVATLSLKLVCAEKKPEVKRVKLIVMRAADIPRSRSADIFRPDKMAAISGLATARAQSETRDVAAEQWSTLLKTEEKSKLETLTPPDTAQTENNNGAVVRPSLIPRPASTGDTGGSVPRSPAAVDTPPGCAPERPGQTTGSGRKTPRPTNSSSRSLIPRLVTDNRTSHSTTDARSGADSSNEQPSATTHEARLSVSCPSPSFSCPGAGDAAPASNCRE